MNLTIDEAYELLNVDSNATLDEVKDAYYKVLKNYNYGEYQDVDMIKKSNMAFEMINEDINNRNLSKEIRKTQEIARAKVQAKAREQERREEERKKSIEREKIRRIQKIYSDLIQSKEFKKHNISESYFIENINSPECSKWGNIHLYASSIYSKRDKYIKEYGDSLDNKNATIEAMVPFTSLNPNPITQGKKQDYKIMLNQRYGTIGEAINTVYRIFVDEINYITKCVDFTDENIMSYLIGDKEYQDKIWKIVDTRLRNYYKIAKFIYSKEECYKELDENEFLNIKSNKYNTDINRMKNIENYVNRVYIFKEDGSIGINNTSITRTEYQKAREWLMVVKTNNMGKVDHNTIIIYMNYVAGCMEFIYKKIPHPEFNPNVDPLKLLDIAKVINTLEKYYMLALEDGIGDCYSSLEKVKDYPKFKKLKMSQVLEILLELNKKRKIINKYYLHSYYSLDELAKMEDKEVKVLFSRAEMFRDDIETYLEARPAKEDLVDLYLKKLKDNKKFAPLFAEDVTFIEIMNYLEVKQYELDNLKIPNKPSLINFIFMNSSDLMALKEAPLYEKKRDFIMSHNPKYNKATFKGIDNIDLEQLSKNLELDEMSNKQIDLIYRETVVDFLNNNLPKYKSNPINLAALGRLDTKEIDELIEQAEDEVVKECLLLEISNGYNGITENDVLELTPMERIKMLKDIKSKK